MGTESDFGNTGSCGRGGGEPHGVVSRLRGVEDFGEGERGVGGQAEWGEMGGSVSADSVYIGALPVLWGAGMNCVVYSIVVVVGGAAWVCWYKERGKGGGQPGAFFVGGEFV